MSTGPGFTSCLICKDVFSLELNNKLIQNIVKLCYRTDEYNIMLKCTRMCSCCIGRMHQLYGFIMYKDAMERDRRHLATEDPEMQCQFCYQTFIDYELIADHTNLELRKTVTRTPFIVDFPADKRFKACYSCYNFLNMYSEYRTIFNECHQKFFTALQSVRVVLNAPTKVKQEVVQEEVIVDAANVSTDIEPDDYQIPPEVPDIAQSESQEIQPTTFDEFTLSLLSPIAVPFTDDETTNEFSLEGAVSIQPNVQKILDRVSSNLVLRLTPSPTTNEIPNKAEDRKRVHSNDSQENLVQNESQALVTPPPKQSKLDENLHTEIDQENLFSKFNIKSCSIVLTRIPIKTTPESPKKMKPKKNTLKIKLKNMPNVGEKTATKIKKAKLAKKKYSRKSGLILESIEEQPVSCALSTASSAKTDQKIEEDFSLKLSEELPDTLVVTVDTVDFSNESQEMELVEDTPENFVAQPTSLKNSPLFESKLIEFDMFETPRKSAHEPSASQNNVLTEPTEKETIVFISQPTTALAEN